MLNRFKWASPASLRRWLWTTTASSSSSAACGSRELYTYTYILFLSFRDAQKALVKLNKNYDNHRVSVRATSCSMSPSGPPELKNSEIAGSDFHSRAINVIKSKAAGQTGCVLFSVTASLSRPGDGEALLPLPVRQTAFHRLNPTSSTSGKKARKVEQCR